MQNLKLQRENLCNKLVRCAQMDLTGPLAQINRRKTDDDDDQNTFNWLSVLRVAYQILLF